MLESLHDVVFFHLSLSRLLLCVGSRFALNLHQNRVPNGSSGLGGPGGSDVLSAASTPTSLNPDDKSNKGSASRMLGPAGVVMTHWDAGEHCEMMGKRGVVPEDAGTSPWVLNIDEV